VVDLPLRPTKHHRLLQVNVADCKTNLPNTPHKNLLAVINRVIK